MIGQILSIAAASAALVFLLVWNSRKNKHSRNKLLLCVKGRFP